MLPDIREVHCFLQSGWIECEIVKEDPFVVVSSDMSHKMFLAVAAEHRSFLGRGRVQHLSDNNSEIIYSAGFADVIFDVVADCSETTIIRACITSYSTRTSLHCRFTIRCFDVEEN